MKKEERQLYLYNLKHKIDENGNLLKQCSICNEWFICTDENFYKNKTSKEGLSPYCKECEKIKNTKWQTDPKNRESLLKSWSKCDAKRKDVVRTRENSKIRRLNGKYQKWQEDNPDKLKQYRLDREQNKTHTISKKEWIACQEYFNNTCAYCGLSIEEHYIKFRGDMQLGNFHKEHVNHKGTNDLSNCVPSCKICNSEKHTSSLEEWYNENNTKFSQERLDKIHKWMNEDYKFYIKKPK